jgi:glycosyltransferase involved in cell wall biosynthesis
MAVAMDRCDGGYVCFVDADLEESDVNIPARILEFTEETGADMVVGTFHEPDRRMTTTPSLYRPLMGALFPERLDDYGYPLSGFRACESAFRSGSSQPGTASRPT